MSIASVHGNRTYTMDAVGDFLLQVQNATRLPVKLQPQRLLELLRVQPHANGAVVRFNNLGVLNEPQIEHAVEQRRLYSDEWAAFARAVASFVRLCNQLNAWSLLESFDLYTTYLNDLAVAFTHKNRGYLLAPLLQDTIEATIPLAVQLDTQLVEKEAHGMPRLTYIASLLLKIFNNIRSQLGAEDQLEAAKKAVMLYVGTRLCLTYFRLQNPLLCRNVFSNMNNANLMFRAYPPNQQLQYRYYLARFYIVKHQFVDAYTHLLWCLQHVPANYTAHNANVTRILRHLLPVSIILGKRPNYTAFAQVYYPNTAPPAFLVPYSELGQAIRQGNFHHFHTLLNEKSNYAFLKQHQLALFIASKAMVVTLRNLLRKVWVLQGKQAKLDYDSIKAAFRVSLRELDLGMVSLLGTAGVPVALDDFAVENCLITLIDQNLLRGKVFPRLRVVSLAKTEVFPSIDALNFLKFGNGPEGTLAGPDKWMG